MLVETFLELRLMIELPKDHGQSIVKKKGDWACAACGELNLGIL